MKWHEKLTDELWHDSVDDDDDDDQNDIYHTYNIRLYNIYSI
jgi:hypothetical protein